MGVDGAADSTDRSPPSRPRDHARPAHARRKRGAIERRTAAEPHLFIRPQLLHARRSRHPPHAADGRPAGRPAAARLRPRRAAQLPHAAGRARAAGDPPWLVPRALRGAAGRGRSGAGRRSVRAPRGLAHRRGDARQSRARHRPRRVSIGRLPLLPEARRHAVGGRAHRPARVAAAVPLRGPPPPAVPDRRPDLRRLDDGGHPAGAEPRGPRPGGG